ncbi:lipoate--protein ligase A [Lentilactobacillus fungorum]|uniref:Lipoate--protein ligase A n=1 Tax=Lentilactobacillus fungorum TaxID=2201250 RepID=A0ABQ3VW64_9LACO|nr:lipoate--protein ligase [Lentilactobacillus fungorum]GHP13135.1 lipoate--protein ligase A [Lentilactobacillus fungorum]
MGLSNVAITAINKVYSQPQKLLSFADTNALLALCDRLQRPFVHFWTTEVPTLILGINDRHLPNLSAALASLKYHQFDYFLRNSGGLAVISDPKVLNISLFMPLKRTPYSVDEAYAYIAQLIRSCFDTLTIDTYEIVHSYCPGKFDLSVNGQKIAGIAQRRTENAVVLMLYMSVGGNQDDRSQTVIDFYQAGEAQSQHHWQFPVVDPATMTTLQQLGMPTITNDDVRQRFITSLLDTGDAVDLSTAPEFLRSEQFVQEQAKQLTKIQLRNQQLPVV